MRNFTLSESLRKVITEGAESKNMGLAKHYLYNRENMDEPTAMRTIGAIKRDIPNVRMAKCKFILGATRMYCDKELSDGENISKLNRYLKYIASDAHVNEYDQNLNGLSFEAICERFDAVATNDLNAEKEDFAKQNFSSNNNYDIVPIDSFEAASKYSQYTDWCVTNDPSMYSNYTSGGLGRFYFCLRKGFENVPMEVGENCPLDEYGLSMIATSVYPDGSCNTITCRWNHANGGNDHIMGTKELSELVGRNFYDVFKPYSKEELAAKYEQRAESLIDTFYDYASDEVHEVIDYLDDMNDRYDIDDNCYYDDDGDEMYYDDALVGSIKERDDIKDIDDGLSLIAYAGFCDDDELMAENAPCIIIRTKDNARIGSGLFNFDGDFNMWGNYVSAPIFMGPNSKQKLVVLDYASNKYVTNDSFDMVKNVNQTRLGWVAIVANNGVGTNILKNDGTYLFGEWVNGDVCVIENCNLLISNANGSKYITNPNGEVLVNDIAKGTNVSKAFYPWGSLYFIMHTNGVINIYDKLTCKKAAPWNIKELLGEKGVYMRQNLSGERHVWLYKVRLTNGELFLLDEKANLYDMEGNLVKKNSLHESAHGINWIGESVKRYLSEGKETKNMALTKHYLYDKKGMDETTAMQTIGAIKHDIPNVRLAKCKYLLGVARLYLDKELSDSESIMKINQYLRYIASNAHINEYDNNLNGLSFEKLDETFGQVAIDDLETDKKDIASQEYATNSEYEVIPIDTPSDAAKYRQYTDWCITKDSDAYYNYTHGVNGRFYFCLKNGFENVEKVPSKNCPLDEYGLSMIAVSVNADGSCNTITCRWNHDNDGNDHIMTPKELSSIIGRNFYDVFKPFSESEIKARRDQMIEDAITEFDNEYEDIYAAYDYRDIDIILQGSGGRYDNIDVGVYAIDDGSQCILIKSNSNEPLVWDVFNGKFFRRSGDILTVPVNENEMTLLGMDGKYVTSDKFSSVMNCASLGYVIVKNSDGKSNVLVSKNIGRDVSNGWKYLFSEWLDGNLVLSRECDYFRLNPPTEEYDGLSQIYTLDGTKVIDDVSDVTDIRYSDWLLVKKGKFSYFISRKTFRVSAPWEIRQILDIKYGLFTVKLRDNRVLDVDSRNLDLINPNNGQILKKNPYSDGGVEEDFKSLGNMIKESLNKMLSDTF